MDSALDALVLFVVLLVAVFFAAFLLSALLGTMGEKYDCALCGEREPMQKMELHGPRTDLWYCKICLRNNPEPEKKGDE